MNRRCANGVHNIVHAWFIINMKGTALNDKSRCKLHEVTQKEKVCYPLKLQHRVHQVAACHVEQDDCLAF